MASCHLLIGTTTSTTTTNIGIIEDALDNGAAKMFWMIQLI